SAVQARGHRGLLLFPTLATRGRPLVSTPVRFVPTIVERCSARSRTVLRGRAELIPGEVAAALLAHYVLAHLSHGQPFGQKVTLPTRSAPPAHQREGYESLAVW